MTLAPPRTRVGFAVASRSLLEVLEGPVTRSTALGRTTSVIWCSIEEEVIVVGAPGTVRLPNGILADGLRMHVWTDPPAFGAGGMRWGSTFFRLGRWWDPRVTVTGFDPQRFFANVSELRRTFPGSSVDPLRGALARADTGLVVALVEERLGFGPGLTPVADDVLAGAFVAYSSLSNAVGDEPDPWMEALERHLGPVARRQTTALSTSLLRHALRGEAAPEVGRFILAVGGNGDPRASLQRLMKVGSTSGAGLARGVLVGAMAVEDRMRL